MDRVVERLLESYADCGGIKHLNGCHLPSKTGVAALIDQLLHLVFPGFIFEETGTGGDLVPQTSERLERFRQRLAGEIRKCLEFCPADGKSALDLATAFLEQLPSARALIQTDVEAAYQGDPAAANRAEVVLAYPGVEAVAVFRLAHELHRLGVCLLPRMMTEWAHGRTGIDIHPGAKIGTHFFIDHGTGVVIGGTAEIGNRVRLYQGVGLVARSLAKEVQRDEKGVAVGGKRHPTVGDDVTIYAGATIIGADTVIGARSIVGGNVWLTRSIPPDSVVLFEAQQVSIHSRQRSGGDWII